MSWEAAAAIANTVIALIAVITLIAYPVRGLFSLERRLTALETKMEPWWDALRQSVVPALLAIKPTGNPVTTERWRDLVMKLQANSLSRAEAEELHNALLEQQEEAKKKNDLAVLLAIGLGLLLLSSFLKDRRQAA